jgi:maltooligosyltrehalose trehalohydrolase
MNRPARRLPIGADIQPDGTTHFRVWAPDPPAVSLVIERCDAPRQDVAMTREADGYYSASVEHAGHGDRYRFQIDGDLVPDPASRFQPDGPFGASQVIDAMRYQWQHEAWRGITLEHQVIYELHVGTFTPEGTWRAAAQKLPLLADVGISVIEVMPVAEFPGRFGWGYDGVFPYAPTRLYGTADDFRAFVDTAHGLNLAVILDVVYNHLGPDGCVFRRFAGRYFTDRYPNEWGEALNFDAAEAGPAREYWQHNGAYWIDEFHLDGLRLDATQSIHDPSGEHILAAMTREARAAAGDRAIILIAENEPQNVRLVRPLGAGGYGLDALWNDDFHHSAVVALTGRREAYYTDYQGTPQEFVAAAKYGYLFQGQRYAWQKDSRGTPTCGLPPSTFVNFLENHDQVANSGDGSRLRLRSSAGAYRALTALTMLMPGTPMLFQGQEFGATTPFLYFADHRPELAAAVQNGRAAFIAQFASVATADMQRQLAAPHAPATFERCKLDWSERDRHACVLRLYRDLIALRRRDVAFAPRDRASIDGAVIGAEAFVVRFFTEEAGGQRLLLVNLGVDLARPSIAEPLVAPPAGYAWRTCWSSEAPDYGGGGTPEVCGADGWHVSGHSAVVLKPEKADGGDGASGH